MLCCKISGLSSRYLTDNTKYHLLSRAAVPGSAKTLYECARKCEYAERVSHKYAHLECYVECVPHNSKLGGSGRIA